MAKPKLALIPSTVGGSVYSVLPSNGDGDFNFTRASAATRINAQGLIETVAVGDNRLNYPLLDGRVQTCPHLLLEPQRTNLIPYSNNYNLGWVQYSSSVDSTSVISPDGTLNGSKVTRGSNQTPLRYSSLATLGTEYTFSLYAKKGSIDTMFLDIGDVANAGFTLTDEWQRFTVTSTPATFQHIDISFGTSVSGDYIYIYGAQLEAGSYPTSYIVSNSGSATTRLAEVCDGSGNASTFNSSEGVLMAQIGALANDGNRYITLTNGAVNSYGIRILYQNGSGSLFFQKYVNGTRTTNLATPIITANNSNKIAIRYNSTNIDVWFNGLSILTNSDTNVIPLNTLNVLSFDIGDGSSPFYGKTKQVQYFDSALTDSELETLTSWMSFSDMAIDLNYTIQ